MSLSLAVVQRPLLHPWLPLFQGAKETMSLVTTKGKSFSAHRTIRKYDEDFNNGSFIDESLDIYIKAHEALAR